MFRSIHKVSNATLRQIKRWVAWLTLVNYLLAVIYATAAHVNSSWIFMIGASLLGYNYLLVRMVISIPKRTFVMKSHRYLAVPCVVSVFTACAVIVVSVWR
ncbi:hypothetical protein HUO09_11080 [Vibrio sp. Y2-5]|uniref:hypothetical protein n=1 Tax=Vibrio sp. Y2-5 TaxID=2743977 RepID=UPI0016617C90|nr:hypothetical protein [Vibrio sp. Y2-5]MBD0786886.1 hypothetical protein [Vibrio sp. Y2-5]